MCGSVVDPKPKQIQGLAEHLAISMYTTFFFVRVFIFAWQHMQSIAPTTKYCNTRVSQQSIAPTTKCCNTRVSQPPRVGLASFALLCTLKELLLSSVIVGEQALDIDLVDARAETVIYSQNNY